MNDLLKSQNAAEMVDKYNKALELMQQGYTSLSEAEKLLHEAFGAYNGYTNFDTVSRDYGSFSHSSVKEYYKNAKKGIQKGAWCAILGILQVSKVLSIKRAEEMHKRLEDGGFPEVTIENLFDLIKMFMDNSGDLMQESLLEAWNILHPTTHGKGYKTNHTDGIGKRVVLSWYWVRHGYKGGKFQVAYDRTQSLKVVDRAFHILDSAGIPEGYESPLIDAINTSPTGTGETEYFIFKCHENGNLHLTMKRMDLVQKLNALAGGDTTLGAGKKKRAAAATPSFL